MDKYKDETVNKAFVFSFWIAPVDHNAEALLHGIEKIFNRILDEYNIYLSKRVEDSCNEQFLLDLRKFQSIEEINGLTSMNDFCGFQCKLKSDSDHSCQCEFELAYNFPLVERQRVIVYEKEKLIYIIEDLILSIVLPGMIGFDYADFANMLKKSSSIIACSIFERDSLQEKEFLELDKNVKHNTVVFFSFSKKEKGNYIEKVSQWVNANYDDQLFNLIYYSCVLRNNNQEQERRSIFIGRDIGGSDGHL
jgi:hypothetical protein